jgi:hypothetical protein
VEALRNAGLASLLGLLISAAPLVMALSFAFWPSERKLALMRPLSLAGTYAAVANIMLGLLNGLVGLARPAAAETPAVQRVAVELAQGIVPAFVAFALLAAAWVCVALGMRKPS